MGGDRTRLEALQRLDLGDTQALQDLVYSYFDEALGGLLGPGSGCLSAPSFALSVIGPNYYVDVGACQLYYSAPAKRGDGTEIAEGGVRKAWHGRVLTHDPVDSGQASLSRLDYTAVRALARASAIEGIRLADQAAYPYLWARPIAVDAETGARRKWSVALGDEVAFSPNTRTVVRVQWALSLSQPVVDAVELPYACVGRIVHWTLDGGSLADVPTLRPLSPWDPLDVAALTIEPSSFAGDRNLPVPPTVGAAAEHSYDFSSHISRFLWQTPTVEAPDYASGALPSLGLVQALALSRERFKVLGRSPLGGQRPWYELPPRNLWDLATAVAPSEAFHAFAVAAGGGYQNLVILALGEVDNTVPVPVPTFSGFGLTYDSRDDAATPKYVKWKMTNVGTSYEVVAVFATSGVTNNWQQDVRARVNGEFLELVGFFHDLSAGAIATSDDSPADPHHHTVVPPAQHSHVNRLRAFVMVIGKPV